MIEEAGAEEAELLGAAGEPEIAVDPQDMERDEGLKINLTSRDCFLGN